MRSEIAKVSEPYAVPRHKTILIQPRAGVKQIRLPPRIGELQSQKTAKDAKERKNKKQAILLPILLFFLAFLAHLAVQKSTLQSSCPPRSYREGSTESPCRFFAEVTAVFGPRWYSGSRRASSSATAAMVERICASPWLLVMKNRSRAALSSTAG